MDITKEQAATLDGARGEYLAQCMRWLVEWGDAMGARRLIPVDNTHVLLPVPNLIARGAPEATVDRFVAELREACVPAAGS